MNNYVQSCQPSHVHLATHVATGPVNKDFVLFDEVTVGSKEKKKLQLFPVCSPSEGFHLLRQLFLGEMGVQKTVKI